MLGILIWSVNLTATELYQAQKYVSRKYGQNTPAENYGKLIVAAGDSQTWGLGDTSFLNDNYAAKSFKGIGMPLGTWMNVGQSSQKTPNLDPWAASNIDGLPAMTGVPTHLWYLESYNIQTDADPGAGNLAYCANRKAAGFGKIALLTCYDDKAHWSGSTATSGPRYTYLNELIAGYASHGVSDLIRVDQDANLGTIGSCPSASPYGSYFADGIHLTTAGDAIVKGYYQPVVAAW